MFCNNRHKNRKLKRTRWIYTYLHRVRLNFQLEFKNVSIKHILSMLFRPALILLRHECFEVLDAS